MQALPDLLDFWSKHGIGLLQRHSLLQWSGDGLTELASNPAPGTPCPAAAICTTCRAFSCLRAVQCTSLCCACMLRHACVYCRPGIFCLPAIADGTMQHARCVAHVCCDRSGWTNDDNGLFTGIIQAVTAALEAGDSSGNHVMLKGNGRPEASRCFWSFLQDPQEVLLSTWLAAHV